MYGTQDEIKQVQRETINAEFPSLEDCGANNSAKDDAKPATSLHVNGCVGGIGGRRR